MHFGPLEIVAAQPSAVTLNLLFPLARCPLRAHARGRSPSPLHPLAPSRWKTTPMGSLESLLRLRGTGIVRRVGLVDNTKVIYLGSGRKDA